MQRLEYLEARVDTLETYEEWQGATLRKLPVWGDEDAEVNFEWPTEQLWAHMDPNLSLVSIEFTCKDFKDEALSSVRVNYSDG